MRTRYTGMLTEQRWSPVPFTLVSVLPFMLATVALSACVPRAASPSVSTQPTVMFSLTVQNLRRETVTVVPWSGSPMTRLPCGDGVTFRPGQGKAPQLPWSVSVAGANGQLLFNEELPAGTSPKQIFLTPGGAQMIEAGGSHGAPSTPC